MKSDVVIHLCTVSIGIVAGIVVVILILIQIDEICRRIVSPTRLRVKRRNEQRHWIERAISSQISCIRQYVNGGEIYEAESERCITDIVWEDHHVDQLVNDILTNGHTGATDNAGDNAADNAGDNDKCLTPLIVGISLDLSHKSVGQAQDWYLYLAYPQIDTMGRCSYGRRVQTPLVKFGTKLAIAYQSQSHSHSHSHSQSDPINKNSSTTTTSNPTRAKTDLCFLADATSGLGTHILTKFFETYHHSAVKYLIKEPAWMATFAYLIQVKTFKSHSHGTTAAILYGLTRLQLSAALEQDTWDQQTTASKQMTNNTTTNTTNTTNTNKKAIITLPGQSCTTTLLPLLQQMFQHETFLFCHDTCINAVLTGILLQTNIGKQNKHAHSANDTPDTVATITSMPRHVSATIPISLLRNAPTFINALATLPAKHADIVEAWITSVDSFLSLSHLDGEHQQKQMGKRPSLCSIDVKTLVRSISSADYPSSSSTDVELMNMIEHVTNHGSKDVHASTEQHNCALKDAKLILADIIADTKMHDRGLLSKNPLTLEELRAIDKCALTHDGIRMDKLKRFL